MNCISWNCCRLGNQGTVQELAHLVREKDPSVLFLSETWTDEDRLEVITLWSHSSSLAVHMFLWSTRNTPEKELLESSSYSEKSTAPPMAFEASHLHGAITDEVMQPRWLRLDKFMATNEWVVRFHTVVVHHLDSSVSDHKPIWLNTYPIPGQQQRRRPFRFEDMWRDDPTCEPTITTAWIPRTQGSPMVQVQERISWCSAKLKKWVQFGNVTQQLKEKTDQLHWVEERSVLGHGHDSVISIRKEVQELLIREEKMWRQRSRTSWLKEGDRNTKYFHSRASHRRRCNSLVVLRLENGDIITEAEQIGIQFVNYYQELFTVVPLEGVDGVIEGIQPRVMAKMNRKLTCQFTELDVTIAMKQMAPLKAPGPDGMPPIFYQSYWHVGGEDVIAAVLSCLNSGRMITDNVLIAFETLHHMHNQRSGKVGSMALKLDMSKAYDRVEWGFLKQVMIRMGFCDKWISLIMECISTVSYSLLINGEPTGHIIPTRGIRQGPPSQNAKKSRIFFASMNRHLVNNLIERRLPCSSVETLLPQCKKELKDILGVPSIKQYEQYLGLSIIDRRFWWGQKSDQRKIHWLKWDKLCQPKGRGGLGFKELQRFNIALLAKQFWRLMHVRNSLFFKVFSAKFFPNGNIMEASEKTSGSFAWRSILKAKELILLDAIAKIPLSDRAPPDRLIWHATRDGNYTVRSGYHMLLQNSRNSNPECSCQGVPDPLWKTIWASRIPAKALLHEHISVSQSMNNENPRHTSVKWKLPIHHLYKANFDGAFSKETNEGGIGVVIRDQAGLAYSNFEPKTSQQHIPLK
uniref:Uncharacterized protein n=1 Tax=Fagus sylvatica TaxID=28930 RepID=A0A2N9FKU0_FAGSY